MKENKTLTIANFDNQATVHLETDPSKPSPWDNVPPPPPNPHLQDDSGEKEEQHEE